MFVFGSGVLIGTPAGGSPINFGLAQEVSLNIATTTKALYGQYNFPVAIGSGTKKMTGKAKMARISGQALGSLFFGLAPSPGVHPNPVRRGGDRSSSSPYTYSTITTRPSSPIRASLTQARAAAEGRGLEPNDRTIYRVGRRLYVFGRRRRRGCADVLHLHSRRERREHGGLLAADRTLDHVLGQSFRLRPGTGKQFSLLLYNCVAEKLSFGTKVEDFLIPELDFQCFANAAGQVCQFNFGDAA